MRINASQKGTYIAHQHGVDPGTSQLRGHCFVTEPWLYAAGARVGGSFHKLKKQQKMQYIFNNLLRSNPGPQHNKIFCVPMPWAIMHGRPEDLFMLGTGV